MNDMTWCDLVRDIARQYGHDALTDADCNFLLWERTSYPIGGLADVRSALHRYFVDPAAAEALMEAEYRAAMVDAS